MNDAMTMPQYDRRVEDLGNIVELGHVNVTVPDQQKATAFYFMGLGLTRDPYLMAGLDNMWVNVGRGQFHLPTRDPQVVRGTTALVLPDREALLRRLSGVRRSTWKARNSTSARAMTASRPSAPGATASASTRRIRRGSVPCASACRMSSSTCRKEPSLWGIARFYTEILGGIAGVAKDERGCYAWASTSAETKVTYRETDKPLPEYDGHHIQITLVDFSGPHKKLLERGLISEESDQHQYRFLDIVDVDSNKPLFRIEHETRSMKHPMFNRVYVNRNPDMNNRNFVPGYEVGVWALPN